MLRPTSIPKPKNVFTSATMCSGRWVAVVITLRWGGVTMKLPKSCVLVLGLLLGAGLAGGAEKPEPVAEKDAGPAKPDLAVIAAWEKAGAKFGWMDVNNEYGFLSWRDYLEPSVDSVPGFSFRSGSLSKSLQGLPQPGIPFGVFCGNADDAGLKELAGLTQLQTLCLYRTQVTGAGLKELAGLKQLQTLNLVGTEVTDAGLKELKETLPKCEIRHSLGSGDFD